MAAPAFDSLTDYLLRLGDSALILGHRLAEWCGHAPNIEIDIALTNIALDLTGQAQAFLDYAAEREGRGRDADALAYLRDGWDYRNFLLVERPNGDFATTVVRQFLFDVWQGETMRALTGCGDARLAGVAAKAARESVYHEKFSAEWTIRLGDGTDESRRRVVAALETLWPYTGEMFRDDPVQSALRAAGLAPDQTAIKAAWQARVGAVLAEAGLDRPADGWMQSGGTEGRHSEALGHLLAEMQFLPRAYPGAVW